MRGHLHDRWKSYPLATGLSHEPRAYAMPAEVPLKTRKLGAPLHDLAHRGRG